MAVLGGARFVGATRSGWAWDCFWFSLTLAVGCVVGGFYYWPLFFGGGWVLAAYWYFAAIRWVDRNGEWP